MSRFHTANLGKDSHESIRIHDTRRLFPEHMKGDNSCRPSSSIKRSVWKMISLQGRALISLCYKHRLACLAQPDLLEYLALNKLLQLIFTHNCPWCFGIWNNTQTYLNAIKFSVKIVVLTHEQYSIVLDYFGNIFPLLVGVYSKVIESARLIVYLN